MTNNSKIDASTKRLSGVNLSVGSGIAIAAIWFFATVLIIFAALFFFTDVIVDNSAAKAEARNEDGDLSDGLLFAYFLFFVIMLLPGFGAYRLTKMFVDVR